VAVAYRDFDGICENFSVKDESDLILAGYITFLDPPKESARPAIQQLHAHGVSVKVLTGDNEFVTQKICQEIGIPHEKVLLGGMVETLSTKI
jgi:Mg2+-importing ATPase